MNESVRFQYFQHQLNARKDEKLRKLLIKEGWEGIGLFWGLLEELGLIKEHRLQTDYETLEFDMHAKADLIKRVVENYGLFKVGKGYFWNSALNEFLEGLEQKYQKRAAAGKKGGSAKAMLKQTDSNATAMPEQCQPLKEIREEEKREDEMKADESKEEKQQAAKEKADPSFSAEPAAADAAALEENSNDALCPAGGNDNTLAPGATDEIGKAGEFTILWQLFKPHGDFYRVKKSAQEYWMTLDPGRRAIILDHLEKSREQKKRLWTDNPLYYIKYFEEHIQLRIPYGEFYQLHQTTEVPGYCILKERDANGSVFFAKTLVAETYGWPIERKCN